MVKTKKMNEVQFAKLVKEFSALGELIRTRQDEKQAVADRFDDESNRFAKGQISEKTVASSVVKTNKEFSNLDDSIRKTIQAANDFSARARKFAQDQSPKKFTAKLTGVKDAGMKNRAKKELAKANKDMKAAKAKIARPKIVKKAATKKKAAKKSAKKKK